jgi:multiple sugar transport system permease protein
LKPREFWTFVTPSIILMSLLMVLPFLGTVYLSFQNFSYGTAPKFVGLLNYTRVLEDSRFWSAVGFTLLYMIVTIPLQIFFGFTLALLLNEIPKLKRLFVSGFLLPFIVTPVVGTLVVSWLFRDRGLYTWLLSLVGLNIQWYAETFWSRSLLMMYGVWYTTPFIMLMLYAGLQAMPSDALEAALMDGATWLQRVRYVMVPYLRPIFLFIVMINIMDSYRLFDPVAVMTKGGPGTSSETVMFYTYSVSFAEGLLGRGSSVVILTIGGIMVLLFPFLRQTYRDIVKRVRHDQI